MLPSVIGNHRTIRINRLRQMINGLRELLLPYIMFNGRYATRFIERDPSYDTWMIVLLRYDFQPFLRKAANRLIIELKGRRHFRPDEHAFHITPI